jgi:DNA-binding MarR family transcriptional regulator
MNLAKVQSLLSRRFDRLSLHGIGFNDFTILYLLSRGTGERMRRIDLAEKIGLTASGVTRILLPMEKIGLIKREANDRDARVSYVVLTKTGKQLFEEAKETANYLAREIIAIEKAKNTSAFSDILAELGGNII